MKSIYTKYTKFQRYDTDFDGGSNRKKSKEEEETEENRNDSIK